MGSWADSEFSSIDFGDKRLNDRAKSILDVIGLAPGRTIPQSFKGADEMKACYRFFGNEKITEKKVLQPHLKETLLRIKENPIVLLVNDTTTFNYTSKKLMTGKGSLGKNIDGFFLHPLLAINPQRLCLGIVEANFYTRDFEKKENLKHRKNLSIEEKESFRWLQSYRKASELAEKIQTTNFVYIADREADIIELLSDALKGKKDRVNLDIIIRSQHDRLIDEIEESTGEVLKIRRKFENSPVLGEISFSIPATHERKARIVTQQLKSFSVIIKPHEKGGKEKLPEKINFVMATETLESAGDLSPLCWIFITTLPVETYENVFLIIKYYLCRWEIEIFFKILKSGCKAEERQLQSAEKIKNLLAIYCVVGWRIMYTMMLGRTCPDISCECIFEASEWKSVYKILNKQKSLPESPPKLQEFITMVAILGGYVKNTKETLPGITTIWRGMIRMADFAIAWEAFGAD